mgnify:FL=1
MTEQPKYYIVEASALPEVFRKVAEARRMLETGEAATVNEAVRRTGISRSAYYKYKDMITMLRDMNRGVVTFQLTLRDEAGILSSILTIFAKQGANILTINQSIPRDGIASVSLSCELIQCTAEELLNLAVQTPGVVRAEIAAQMGG